jgi:hypothetical protein
MKQSEAANKIEESPSDLYGPSNDLGDVESWLNVHRSQASSPERLLVLAVLEDALSCLRAAGTSAENRKLKQEARNWFADRADDPFSFDWVCAALSWDADWVRRAVLNGAAK